MMPFRHRPGRHHGQEKIGLDKKGIVASLRAGLHAMHILQGSSPR